MTLDATAFRPSMTYLSTSTAFVSNCLPRSTFAELANITKGSFPLIVDQPVYNHSLQQLLSHQAQLDVVDLATLLSGPSRGEAIRIMFGCSVNDDI
ncbi:hypothetical protein BDV3_005569 [Batrachochytrium dendrobatidis]